MKKYRYSIIIFIFVLTSFVLYLIGPIPQDLNYHNFADQRKIIGIPNFWNVMSNLPMLFIGAFGISFSLKTWNYNLGITPNFISLLLTIGIFGAFFGSSYYHWAPENNSLVWDRLPMTLMFMPLFALLIYDFVGKNAGVPAFYLLVSFGIFSVFHWQYTESIGQGDLRCYALVQFFPMIIVPIIIWLFFKKADYLRYVAFIIAWYIAAKLAEHYDNYLYDLTGFWSGHTIKHLLACMSLYYILKLLKVWKMQMYLNYQ